MTARKFITTLLVIAGALGFVDSLITLNPIEALLSLSTILIASQHILCLQEIEVLEEELTNARKSLADERMRRMSAEHPTIVVSKGTRKEAQDEDL